MSETVKENTKKFFGLWTVVEDYESATEAAKSASVAAFYITISYVVVFGYLYYTGESLYGAEYSDELELNIAYGMFGFIAAVFLWLGLRIRKEKFGSVPFVALWMLFEIGSKLVSVPGKGIILNVMFTIISINALWGWYKRKQYLKITENA